MQREKSKWKPHEGESADAEHRGGVTRSSVEASVMVVERRSYSLKKSRIYSKDSISIARVVLARMLKIREIHFNSPTYNDCNRLILK